MRYRVAQPLAHIFRSRDESGPGNIVLPKQRASAQWPACKVRERHRHARVRSNSARGQSQRRLSSHPFRERIPDTRGPTADLSLQSARCRFLLPGQRTLQTAVADHWGRRFGDEFAAEIRLECSRAAAPSFPARGRQSNRPGELPLGSESFELQPFPQRGF